MGQDLKIAGYYAAGSPECRTHVLVPVLVHMAMIIIARFWLTFIRQHYIRVRNTCQGQNFRSAKAKKPSTRREGGNGGTDIPYADSEFDPLPDTTILCLLRSSVLQVFHDSGRFLENSCSVLLPSTRAIDSAPP